MTSPRSEVLLNLTVYDCPSSSPRIIRESFVTKNGGSTPRLFESFEESDIVATGLESSGGGEASKA